MSDCIKPVLAESESQDKSLLNRLVQQTETQPFGKSSQPSKYLRRRKSQFYTPPRLISDTSSAVSANNSFALVMEKAVQPIHQAISGQPNLKRLLKSHDAILACARYHHDEDLRQFKAIRLIIKTAPCLWTAVVTDFLIRRQAGLHKLKQTSDKWRDELQQWEFRCE